LKTGLAKQCTWQNNHAILHGHTVFYNKKYVRTSKTKATMTKPIRFYYVMGAGKPAPTIPSDQGFYQPLWDALDRRNRSLKQTAPSQANKASATVVSIGRQNLIRTSVVSLVANVADGLMPNPSKQRTVTIRLPWMSTVIL
jgi:hypothetical protein